LRPAEVSLAHDGVPFLDQLPKFRRSVSGALCQPPEEGPITAARRGGAIVVSPAAFQLIAAMNPCSAWHRYPSFSSPLAT